MGSITLTPLINTLPDDIELLNAEAVEEGFRFVARLIADWNCGGSTFNQPNETLLAARLDNELAAIGGVTVDPYNALELRMRRFYVRPIFRRRGIARLLATSLLENIQKRGQRINVNAATDLAPAFWDSLGFERVDALHHTHVLYR